MRLDKDYIIITDIGSTTTKALLLDNRQETPVLLGITQAETTVEEPKSDVRHGIKAAVTALQQISGITLLQPAGAPEELAWAENTAYFSTSSAGGGLQILVIGLTMFDSASSGKRCAYGAGGVILDTFALDDKRQAAQQMLAMRNLHPDMILLCGGTDGGAISGVLRMAEILRIANPAPKFDLRGKITTLYAGNQDAAPIVKKLISQAFDLHILPNLRPGLEVENLQPTQDLIQKLFMENVMEQAPGYNQVKPAVASPIIPTPLGVQRALAQLAGEETRDIFAFDIGGATTDVFSYINRHFQRTVSANLGMSYSAWNVLREAGLENVKRWLPNDLSEQDIRNYIANKCLHPTSNPHTTDEFRIEHALAREALSLALEQHRQMHYNSEKVGYLDKLKRNDIDKFELQFEYQREDSKHRFKESDIEILIGAGGVFAHAQNPSQCAMILADAVLPKGITELWIDRNFISPHLGVLSDTDPKTSNTLLQSSCIEKLAVHIAPIFDRRSKKDLMTLEVATNRGKQFFEIRPDSFISLPQCAKTLKISLSKHCKLSTNEDLGNYQTELPVLIDTRIDPASHAREVEKTLGLYPVSDQATPITATAPVEPAFTQGSWIKRIELPYAGDINFNEGDHVRPDDVVAVNRFNPPRLYIIPGLSNLKDLSPDQIREALKVRSGYKIEADEIYAELPSDYKLPSYNRGARKLYSPVRGRIEYIDENTGMIVASEIQDYSGKPQTVSFANKLMLPPKRASRYLSKMKGDFVYQGDVLAKRIERTADGAPPVLLKAPTTGTITDIDNQAGTLIITYIHSPMEFRAHVGGVVKNVVPGQSLEIAFQGIKLEGKVAFGSACHGAFKLLDSDDAFGEIRNKIVALSFSPDLNALKRLAKEGVRGVVCYAIDATELTGWLEFEPGVINTGNEDLPFAIMVLNSFSAEPMPEILRKFLSGQNFAYLNPHTRIRAGVVRPFICFTPHPD
ncbi:MAG: glutamate mutase L [Candidatus Cloacimonetes bacterium]|nr:glutamate mutase L [Candidatus Cloacimonadota bacterium]